MRVTSDLFVSALTRRVFNDGGFAAVVRRGAEAAGAILIIERRRDGSVRLYGPAPQTAYGEERPSNRQFVLMTDAADRIDARIEKETRFDPDLWVIEIEPGNTPIDGLLTISD